MLELGERVASGVGGGGGPPPPEVVSILWEKHIAISGLS